MPYEPKPIDSSGVELEPEIEALTELLAKNTHELWAAARIAQGWTPGAHRDDQAKTHPGLVPYESLSESEKEYDRRTAIGTLKAISALGYRIEPAPQIPMLSQEQLFEEHLAQALAKEEIKNFDMHDAENIATPECHPRLVDSLHWLAREGRVGIEWKLADDAANRSQTLHRHLSQAAILGGTAAVVLAILQLVLHATAPRMTGIAAGLEAIAVVAALSTVAIGVIARMHRRWLGHRHRAEQLRMLKFRALARLWCSDDAIWKEWVSEELSRIPPAASFHLSDERPELDDGGDEPRISCQQNDSFVQSLIAYYRVKRLAYQARYFKERWELYEKKTRPWQHISLWLFAGSILCVIVHFVFDGLADYLVPWWEHLFKDLAEWFIALAAILPVAGAAIRAWFGAFELTRSASLFKAKLDWIENVSQRLKKDAHDVVKTRNHIIQIENTLKDEHYEWLRLLRDAEWFL